MKVKVPGIPVMAAVCLVTVLFFNPSVLMAQSFLSVPSSERGDCSRAAGDFDGDGLDDIYYAGAVHFVTNGQFSASRSLPSNQTPGIVLVVADVNRDGRADILSHGDDMIGAVKATLLLGDGHGGFSKTKLDLPGAILQGADFDGDGWVDLICHVPGGLALVSLQADGTSEIVHTLPWPDDWGINGTYSDSPITVADFTNDHRPDVVIPYNSHLVFFFAQADGTFSAPRIRYTHFGARPMSAGDVNGDRNNDLVFVAGRNQVRVLFGDGTGRFPASSVIEVGASRDQANNLVVGDFLSGGSEEIVVAMQNGELVTLSVTENTLKQVSRVSDSGLTNPSLMTTRLRRNRDDVLVAGLRGVSKTGLSAYYVSEAANTSPSSSAGGRRRSVGSPAFIEPVVTKPEPMETYKVSIWGQCAAWTSSWSVVREGIFADIASSDMRAPQGAFLEGRFYIDVDSGGRAGTLRGNVTPTATGYAGTLGSVAYQNECNGPYVVTMTK